ncbi:hypothetical protein [Gimesia aquarii]|uniref:Uncharacterized protein n=1 Tax=Gimesia aquarii TaxID=2527964 RepID=A0A517WZ18_9PLAN|nr:hypothetical protein [Gimesia aquarii]QDU10505.1 hypothetical protein V202x_39170 [Gimesia aquarii]
MDSLRLKFNMIFLLSFLAFINGIKSDFLQAADQKHHSSSGKQTKKTASKKRKKRTVCRLFFQDYKTKTVKWADVISGDTLRMETPSVIKGFPKLDAEDQNLVQMESSSGTILLGVRDSEGGEDQSGWIFINSGVKEESHGDHSHWYYKAHPKVIASQLDAKQGNPAHLYCYQGVFYLANDRISGYTRLDPQTYLDQPTQKIKTGFHLGGGNHITLAVVEGKTGYASWIDGGGPQKGIIDVTRIRPEGNKEIVYSFALPSGAIHGATTCAGKVFFAPADGICWCEADLNPVPQNKKNIKIHHLSLGKDEETKKPNRTGAFSTHRNYVLFLSGKGTTARLCLLNAKSNQPEVISVPLNMLEGNSPVALQVIKTAWGKRLAFVFHNHPKELEQDEFLSVIDLDPDNDLDFVDAKLRKQIKVGPSNVEGHYGHHDIKFDRAGRYAFWTEPGAAKIKALSLKTLEPISTFTVSGTPTKLIVMGQQDRMK